MSAIGLYRACFSHSCRVPPNNPGMAVSAPTVIGDPFDGVEGHSRQLSAGLAFLCAEWVLRWAARSAGERHYRDDDICPRDRAAAGLCREDRSLAWRLIVALG
jgi:hypothetical protein